MQTIFFIELTYFIELMKTAWLQWFL